MYVWRRRYWDQHFKDKRQMHKRSSHELIGKAYPSDVKRQTPLSPFRSNNLGGFGSWYLKFSFTSLQHYCMLKEGDLICQAFKNMQVFSQFAFKLRQTHQSMQHMKCSFLGRFCYLLWSGPFSTTPRFKQLKETFCLFILSACYG